MIIINDPHVGFDRKGGTTPSSREAMRHYLLDSIECLISEAAENTDHLLILGDLFDQFEVDSRDLLDTFALLQWWVSRGKKLTLVAGNHDHSPKALRVSSFQALCTILKEVYFDLVEVIGIDQWAYVDHDTLAVAHCSNQETFDLKLAEVLESVKTGNRILLHANFDNDFAVESDHSLNVSRDQARAFIQKGCTLYFAHEHQARTAMNGSVVVFGNQWPTSVSDCLHNDKKFAHSMTGSVTKLETWSRDGLQGFKELDWRELTESNADFIRVTGKATSNEASDVINAISKFRQKSSAFVITNAVKVEGIAEVGELPESFEAAKAFDVRDFISQHLTAEEMVVVEGLQK